MANSHVGLIDPQPNVVFELVDEFYRAKPFIQTLLDVRYLPSVEY